MGSAVPTNSIAQTLDRGLQVLEAVAHSREPLTVAQAAASVGLDRTVAHRLIGTLSARGYLQREGDGGYRLGPTCLALASSVTDLRAVARPFLEALRDMTGETVHLVVLTGRDVVFIDGIESVHALRVTSRTGRVVPAHATSVGKAWLAALPPGRVEELYGRTKLAAVTRRTINDQKALALELAAIRERGYAKSDGESENGVGSIGVVVRNSTGEPRAAVSVALPLNRWSEAYESEAVAALQSVAASLGARL